MIIQEIEIKDFRPFNGIQKIILSEDNEKNITFIHAENGSGKTTLLEAIKWCLYGVINLPNKDEFVNHKAGSEVRIYDEINVYAKIIFKDEEFKYTAVRNVTLVKKGINNFIIKGKPEFSLLKVNNKGEKQRVLSAQNEILRIIPIEMNFFFDGERLKSFDNKLTLKKAIEGVLGVEGIYNAIKHIKGARKQINDDLSNLQKKLGNIESFTLRKTLSSLEENNESYKLQIINLNEKINTGNILYEKSIKKLQNIDIIKNIINDLKQKEKKSEGLSIEILNQEKKIRDYYAKNAYKTPVAKLLNNATKILLEQNQEKKSKIKISEALINDILKNQKCICGNNIELNSNAYFLLEALKESSSSNNMSIFIDNALHLTKETRILKDSFYNFIEANEGLLNRFNLEKDELEIEIQKLNEKIKKNKNIDIQEIEKDKDSLKKEINNNIQIKSSLENKIDQNFKKIDDLNKKIKDLDLNNEQVNLLKNRVKFSDLLINDLEILLDLKKKSIKSQLERKIRSIYSKVNRKNYTVLLDDDFLISIIDSNTNKVAAVSTGEQLIANLCFIGALADIGRTLHNKNSSIETGRVFPIVLDSPFGVLDTEHILEFVKILPLLAEQIILFASSSQLPSEVKPELSKKVGEQYALYNNHNRKEIDDKENKYQITLIYKKNNEGKWIKSGVHN